MWICHTHWKSCVFYSVCLCEWICDLCTIDCNSELFGLALVAHNVSDGADVDAAVFRCGIRHCQSIMDLKISLILLHGLYSSIRLRERTTEAEYKCFFLLLLFYLGEMWSEFVIFLFLFFYVYLTSFPGYFQWSSNISLPLATQSTLMVSPTRRAFFSARSSTLKSDPPERQYDKVKFSWFSTW